MLYVEENQLGKIEFDERIIGNIIRRAADSFEGRVMLSGAKVRIKKNSPKDKNSDDITFMNMKNTEDGYVIDIYIVLKFGTSIRRTSNELIAVVREQVEKITELNISKVRVIITGMLSKNFSRRHIEVEG